MVQLRFPMTKGEAVEFHWQRGLGVALMHESTGKVCFQHDHEKPMKKLGNFFVVTVAVYYELLPTASSHQPWMFFGLRLLRRRTAG